MASKINLLRSKVLPDGILMTRWLEQNGISRSDLTDYIKHGTLDRIATGIYKYPGTTPTLFGIISSCQSQSEVDFHLGAATALEVSGYSHYITMSKPEAIIFSRLPSGLPRWIARLELDMSVHEFSTKVFGETGIETIDYQGYSLRSSSTERAIMECILLSPKYYSLMDLYHLMEMLNSLRSSLVQKLLEECTSVKVKRLFLYYAEKAGHRWFRKLDLNKISLGSGTRALVKGGIKNAKYNLMIPAELANYEGNI